MAKLQLPTCARTSVFRACEKVLRTDPVFSSVVSGKRLRTWSGLNDDAIPFAVSMAPCVRLTPIGAPETWEFPSATVGPLMIHVEMVIAGFDYDDVLNLYWAMERAFYPVQNTFSIQGALVAAGAKTGLVLFTQPTYDPTPDSNYFHAFGQMRIDVLLQLAV